MQLGPRFALEWVTIEWLNVDAVRIHSAKINLTSRQKSGACCGWSECNGFCQAIGYISKAQKSDILVQIPLYKHHASAVRGSTFMQRLKLFLDQRTFK